jgi:hypothetical protein
MFDMLKISASFLIGFSGPLFALAGSPQPILAEIPLNEFPQ